MFVLHRWENVTSSHFNVEFFEKVEILVNDLKKIHQNNTAEILEMILVNLEMLRFRYAGSDDHHNNVQLAENALQMLGQEITFSGNNNQWK